MKCQGHDWARHDMFLKWNDKAKLLNPTYNTIQGGPEISRQSDLAEFTVEGGLDSTFPYVK